MRLTLSPESMIQNAYLSGIEEIKCMSLEYVGIKIEVALYHRLTAVLKERKLACHSVKFSGNFATWAPCIFAV